MKIALCFWGQPRCIENEQIYEGIKKNILLNPAFTTDVYYQTWFSENGSMVGSNWSGCNHKFHPKTLDFIFDRYRNNLQRLIWMQQPNFLEDERFKHLRKQMYNNMNVSACMVHDRNFDALCSQMVATNEVANLLRNFGKLDQYDWIIVMRQDCLLNDFHNLNELDPDKFYCANYYDVGMKDDYYIFHPKYLSTLNLIEGLQTYTVHPNIIPNAEHIRLFQFTKYVNPDNIVAIDNDCKYHTIIRQ